MELPTKDKMQEFVDTYDAIAYALREIVEADTPDFTVPIDHWWYDTTLECFAMAVERAEAHDVHSYTIGAEYVPFEDVMKRVEENHDEDLQD